MILQYDLFSILGTSLVFLPSPFHWCIWPRLGDCQLSYPTRFLLRSALRAWSFSFQPWINHSLLQIWMGLNFIVRLYNPAQFLTKFNYLLLEKIHSSPGWWNNWTHIGYFLCVLYFHLDPHQWWLSWLVSSHQYHCWNCHWIYQEIVYISYPADGDRYWSQNAFRFIWHSM